ncbi:IS110 family transposase [Endozoicomonas sp. 4G]|uniref:IS110 family transposase n=1 Tax=Endozoicomonas sp. 4G TaxID=2872754 RepID=UPI0020785411|nr:IS110 family transposase [Endozoicomonas sp. 4G]
MHAELESMLTPVYKLTRDMTKGLRQNGGGVTDSEARYLVDLYYNMQANRIAVGNQSKGLERDAKKSGNTAEPHEAIDWVGKQFTALEDSVAKLLAIYTETHPMAWFFDQTTGIGPILAAGLLAHIDINKAPTAGHIWRFAGLDPNVQWCSREQAKAIWTETKGPSIEERLVAVAEKVGRNPANLIHMATHKPDGTEVKLTEANACSAISRKPFNGPLKTLCWKIGESFVKVSNHPDGFYGRVYRERKTLEWKRNLAGMLSDQATKALTGKKIGKQTDAHAWYSGGCSAEKARALLESGTTPTAAACKADDDYPGVPMLPPAQIQMRSQRYAVKLFLSHLQESWWRQETGTEPPAPWVIAHGGHAHYIKPPQIAQK